MELKHYRKEGNEYVLVAPSKRKNNILLIILLILVLGGVYAADYLIRGQINASGIARMVALLCLFLLFVVINNRTTLCIRPDECLIIEKKKKGETTYRSDQFLNFERTRMKMYGLVTVSWSASIFFNIDGKNKKVFLTSNKTEKELEEIIAETTTLLNLQPV